MSAVLEVEANGQVEAEGQVSEDWGDWKVTRDELRAALSAANAHMLRKIATVIENLSDPRAVAKELRVLADLEESR